MYDALFQRGENLSETLTEKESSYFKRLIDNKYHFNIFKVLFIKKSNKIKKKESPGFNLETYPPLNI